MTEGKRPKYQVRYVAFLRYRGLPDDAVDRPPNYEFIRFINRELAEFRKARGLDGPLSEEAHDAFDAFLLERAGRGPALASNRANPDGGAKCEPKVL